jgi:hypothetical protein
MEAKEKGLARYSHMEAEERRLVRYTHMEAEERRWAEINGTDWSNQFSNQTIPSYSGRIHNVYQQM